MFKFFKRLMVVLLSVILLQPVSVNAATSPYSGISSDRVNEIKGAISLGLVPDNFTNSYKSSITEKEASQIMLNCIEKYTQKKNTVWRKKVSYAKSTEITRQKLAELLYLSARELGMDLERMSSLGVYAAYYKIDNLDSKFAEDWVKNHTMNNRTEGINCSYWDFSSTLGEDFKNFNQITSDSIDFVTQFGDKNSTLKVMELTSDYRFQPERKATYAETVIAVYRLYNGMEAKPEYVSLEKVGNNTIDKSLLKLPSSLPEVTNQLLPAWNGVTITNKAAASSGCLFGNLDRNFHEAEIKFLSDNGFNMVRVQLSFSSLSFPDYPKGKVNERELEELDQLIAWGIKYNIHINICMEGQPEMVNKWPDEIYTGDFFTNKAKQKNVLNYWKMLSKRYSNIPNKYLSFNLMNEPEAENDDKYTEVFTPIVNAIWKECPDRVLVADVDSNNMSGEGLAKLGVALSYHYYEPNIICYYGQDFFTNEFPFIKNPQSWPLLYFPATLSGYNKRDSLTIEGDFSDSTFSIYVRDAYIDKNELTVLADGNVILAEEIKGGNINEYNMVSIQKKYTVKVPNGTKKIEVKVNEEGMIRFYSISLTQNKKTTTIYPHDLRNEDYDAVIPTLQFENGVFSAKEKNLLVDWNYLYNKSILPVVELTKKYNVGFMIGEFAPFGPILPTDTLLPYLDTILKGFKEEGIGWSNGGYVGENYLINYYDFKGEYSIKKAKGTNFYYNADILNTYKKYLN